MVVKAFEIDATKDDNTLLLNELTDDVSFKVKFKKNITLAYLLGKNNYLSLPDKNKNVRN